jgi:4-amino-4-deoxy-L-arabinose transferase-like glycosyltransferase
MHVDESSVAYNSYCIVRAGADEHGNAYPLFFKCFGNYQDPVMPYFSAPMVMMFGLEKWAVRFPASLFHILAALAFYFLAYLYTRNKWISLAGAFVFSILPWIFPLSRTAIGGYAPMLLGIAGGCYFLFSAIGKKSRLRAVLAGLFWAFAMYSHHPGRPMSAVALICFVLSLNMLIIKRWKIFAAFVVCYVFSLLPLIISVLMNPQTLTGRFNAISVWRDNPGFPETCARIIERYLEYFGPQFLFISGDSNYTHSTQTSGVLFLFMLPFIIFGIYAALKYFRNNPYYRFLLLVLLTYPFAAMLTIVHRHGSSCMNGSIYWALVAALGAKYIIGKKKYRLAVFIPVIILAGYEIPTYYYNYFSKYKESSRWIFSANVVEAIDDALRQRKPGETLYISKYIFFPEKMQPGFKPEFYTNILFLAKVKPEIYIERKEIPPEDVCLYDGNIKKTGIFLRLDALLLTDKENKIVPVRDYEKIPEKAVLIKRIPTPSGINFEIYRVEK